MGKTKIKICGLKRPEDIWIVNRLKPDFVGFVFAESKRKIDNKQAEKLREALDPDIPAVGVFVNEPIQNVTELCREGIIQLVQLHGNEDDCYIEEIRKNLPDTPLIKAVRVQSKRADSGGRKAGCGLSASGYLCKRAIWWQRNRF